MTGISGKVDFFAFFFFFFFLGRRAWLGRGIAAICGLIVIVGSLLLLFLLLGFGCWHLTNNSFNRADGARLTFVIAAFGVDDLGHFKIAHGLRLIIIVERFHEFFLRVDSGRYFLLLLRLFKVPHR